MGAGASSNVSADILAATCEDINATVNKLDPEAKAKLLASLSRSTGSVEEKSCENGHAEKKDGEDKVANAAPKADGTERVRESTERVPEGEQKSKDSEVSADGAPTKGADAPSKGGESTAREKDERKECSSSEVDKAKGTDAARATDEKKKDPVESDAELVRRDTCPPSEVTVKILLPSGDCLAECPETRVSNAMSVAALRTRIERLLKYEETVAFVDPELSDDAKTLQECGFRDDGVVQVAKVKDERNINERLKEGHTAEELKSRGAPIDHFVKVDYTVSQLIGLGFGLKDLVDADFTPDELYYEMSFPSPEEWKKVGYGFSEVSAHLRSIGVRIAWDREEWIEDGGKSY